MNDKFVEGFFYTNQTSQRIYYASLNVASL